MNNLDQLAYALEMAKQHEAEARNVRLAAEDALIAAVGLKDEGTQTAKTDWYKVSVTQSLTRSLTPDFAERLDALDPAIFCTVIRHKPEVNVSALKQLATANPDAYRLACSAIVTKPSKPSVKVERIETQQKEAA
jgi:hypothetical protein